MFIYLRFCTLVWNINIHISQKILTKSVSPILITYVFYRSLFKWVIMIWHFWGGGDLYQRHFILDDLISSYSLAVSQILLSVHRPIPLKGMIAMETSRRECSLSRVAKQLSWIKIVFDASYLLTSKIMS